MTELLRSNIEFAKRVFLDRLTCDNQPLLQPDKIDEGPGDEYEYGGCFDPFNFGVGADCSGLCGIVIGAAIDGPDDMYWGRLFSTETFPGKFGDWFRQTSRVDCMTNYHPIKVYIMHGGGGPNSHMACEIDGWWMESNGDYGVCTMRPNINPPESDIWNDWWVCDFPINEDTAWRQPMGYPRGLDYAGGRPSGSKLAAAGITFVCRYLTDGGPGLPGKQLTPDELLDLVNHGIQIVFNWETWATAMLNGGWQGTQDATVALNYIRNLPGVPGDYNPVVYFSADWAAREDQQDAINDYLRAAAGVLGGTDKVGVYGSYYVVSRALDAGVCRYAWQTEAWSDGNVDARVNIVQRNSIGYQYVDGVQADINEAHTDDYGQFPGGDMDLIMDQLMGPIGADGQRHGWEQLNNRSLVDALAEIGEKLGLSGYHPPQ
jgi:hypothetical protein